MPPVTANAVASAHDATVVIENNVGALSAALEAAMRREKADRAVHLVERLRYKVEKQRAQLAATEQALADAEGTI